MRRLCASAARSGTWPAASAIAARMLGTLCLTCLILLTGCSELAGPASPLPDLHLPGVAKVPGSAQLVARVGFNQIDTLATYTAFTPSGGTRLLAIVGSALSIGGTLYDMGLDGSTPHALRLVAPCLRTFAVTPASRWAACDTDRGSGIELFALDSTDPARASHVLTDPSGDLLGYPAWAPDGRHLAAAQLKQGHDIRVFTLAANSTTLALTARLVLPPPLIVQGLSWSPDGAWMTVLASDTPASGGPLYVLHMAPLLPRLFGHEAAPVSIPLSAAMLTRLHPTGTIPVAWSGVPNVLTLVNNQEQNIVQRDLVTGAEATLVSQHTALICALSWTPDGRQLVFVLCNRGTIDYPGPPAQLYTYTPADA